MVSSITYKEISIADSAAVRHSPSIQYREDWSYDIHFSSVRITTLSLAAPQVGVVYTADITAIGGSESGYEWTVVYGTVPPGLTLAASGTPTTTLSGTPTLAGTYTFTVRVTDDGGNVDDQEYTLTVAELAVVTPPTIRLIGRNSADINGGTRLSVASSAGSFYDTAAQMSITDSFSAPAEWTLGAGWMYKRVVGLTGSAVDVDSSSVEIFATDGFPVVAGDARILISNWQSTDADGDFGVEWRNGNNTARLVLRGLSNDLEDAVTGVFLEIERNGNRTTQPRIALSALPSPSVPVELRLVYGLNRVRAFVDGSYAGSAAFNEPDNTTTTLHLVVTSRTGAGTVCGKIASVQTLPAVFVDSVLADIEPPQANTRTIRFIAPRAPRFDRMGQRDIVVSGYFGEVTGRRMITYVLSRGNIVGLSGVARRR